MIFGLSRSLVLKIAIYGTLVFSFGFFLVEDWLASNHTYRGGITLSNLTDAFASSADSFAWLILLAIFELETWQLDDKKLTRSVTLVFAGVSAIAYGVIVLAFLGYYAQARYTANFEPAPDTLCESIGGDALSLATGPDNYIELEPGTCKDQFRPGFLYNADKGILSPPDVHSFMVKMAWTDVLNSFTWLVVVVVLQIDVWLELAGKRSGSVLGISKGIKLLLYSILALCCVYWFYHLQVADGIDALFWLLAFFLIELNMIAWHDEKEAGDETALPAPN